MTAAANGVKEVIASHFIYLLKCILRYVISQKTPQGKNAAMAGASRRIKSGRDEFHVFLAPEGRFQNALWSGSVGGFRKLARSALK